ncbi:MAG TPA: hypothetical protein VN784_04995 [Candidatus Limnocylindrales bacterium]|nr:hypothetical protein [Candidatus Limnocylindrales bacterium]
MKPLRAGQLGVKSLVEMRQMGTVIYGRRQKPRRPWSSNARILPGKRRCEGGRCWIKLWP